MVSLTLALSACTAAASSNAHGAERRVPATAPTKKRLLAELAALEGYPKFTPPGAPLDAKRLPRSTKVVVIDNSPSVGPLEETSAGVISAAQAVGLKPVLLNGGANNTASDDISLLEEAVNLHPAVVLQVGIITALETGGLNYAKAHHVPVIAVDNNEPVAGASGEGSGPLVAATAQADNSGEGKAMAEYVAAHGPANATIGAITVDDIVSSQEIYRGFLTSLHTLCPHCTVIAQNVDTADWTTEVTSTVTSMFDAHPNMTYLFPVVDGMTPWVTLALTARSHRPSVISVNGTPGIAISAVKSGLYSADIGASPALSGWYAFDAALRVMLKSPPQTRPTEPMTLFTTPEVKARKLNPNSITSLYRDAFEAGFRKLWGIG